MQTNRLTFVDVDTSASLPQPSAVTGFTVIKAPKGTTKPQYVAKGNTYAILSLFGAPSSSYPGIQEVIDFNQAYGLWVSAPGGSIPAHENYSYFGGTWVTKRASTEPFYHVTEDSDGLPEMGSAITLIDADNISSPYVSAGISKTYGTATVVIDNIPEFALDTSKVGKLYFSFPRSDGTTANVEMTLVGNVVHAVNPTGGADLTVGAVAIGTDPDTKKITISSSATYAAGDYTDLYFADVTTKSWYSVSGSAATLASYLGQAGDWFDTNGRITWEYDITDDTIMGIYQTSPRTTSATLSITDVDARQVTYNKYTGSFALTGTTVTSAGTIVTLLGTSLTVTNGMSNTALVTALAALTIPGYTLGTANGGATLTVANIGPSYPAAVAGDLSFGLVTGVSSVFTTVGIGTSVVNPNYNTMSFRYSESAYPGATYSKAFRVSTDINAVDGSGNNLYVESVLDGNIFLGAKVFDQIYETLPGSSWSSMSDTLVGTRAVLHSSFDDSTDLSVVLQSGWDKASGDEYQDVKMFFEPECQSSLVTTLANYRNNQYIFSTFVTGVKVPNGQTTSASEVAAVVQALVTARSGYPNLSGLAYYCNEFKVTENYSGTSYWNIPVGSVASMLAKIMEDRLGGAAPMFVNENSLGGQLTKSVKKQKYNFDAGSLDILDAAALNPIILDTMYGLMITSQKTAQSPMSLSDWSFLGHSMAFDLFRDEVKKGVMIPQIGKLIDSYHLNLRKEQVTTILNKRLKGLTAIWAEGVVYVNEVNTPETLAQNKFMIKVRVKVNPFSEYVELIFNNVGQSTTIS